MHSSIIFFILPLKSPFCLMALSLAFSLSLSTHSPLCLTGAQSGIFILSSNPLCPLPHVITVLPIHSLLFLMGLQYGQLTLSSTPLSSLPNGLTVWPSQTSWTQLSTLPNWTTVWPSYSLLHSTLPSASLVYSLALLLPPPLHLLLCLMGLHSNLLTSSYTPLFTLPHWIKVFLSHSLLNPCLLTLFSTPLSTLPSA